MTEPSASADRPGRTAVSPRHLIFTVLLLVALVGVYTFLDARRIQAELERELRERSTALLWTLLASSRNARAGSSLLEGLIRQRLLDNAHLVDRLLAAGGMSASQLDQISIRNRLRRIEFLDRTGKRLSGLPVNRTAPRPLTLPQVTGAHQTLGRADSPRARAEAERPAGLVHREAGREGWSMPCVEGVHPREGGAPTTHAPDASLGVTARKPGEGSTFGVVIPAESFPGFVAIHADDDTPGQFRERMGVQRLLEELGERADVAYVALLDSHGRVVAHSDPHRVGSQETRGSPEVATNERGNARRVVREGVGEVYEIAAPFPLGEDGSAEVRLGLSVASIRMIWAQDRRKAIISTGSILLAGILGVLAIFLNQRRYLQSVQTLQEKAQRNQRLAALGNLAAGVAHEIRNPLNALAMGLQRLVREWRLAPDEDRAEFARLGRVLQGEVDRLNDIVERFLQLARPAQLVLGDCPVEQHLGELLALVREEATEKRIVIETGLALSGITARQDCGQVHQALLNIILNAMQAMPHGGRLRFTARAAALQLEVAIADTGPGIPPEHLPRIFEPYFTTKAGGTGLGLAIAQRIVEAHGGSIRVDSRVGVGTTFRITLPLAGPSGAPHA